MSCITYYMMQKLKAVGFSFPAYENFLNLGMVFHYKDDEYYVGGFCNSEYSESDIAAAKEGCWLPTETELLEWLRLVGFDVNMKLIAESGIVSTEATDCVNHTRYSASGGNLSFALYKLIYKICKSGLRSYVPAEIDRIRIDSIQ